MFALGRSWATLCTLAPLFMGVMSGTLARPSQRAESGTQARSSERGTSPVLDITTSIVLGCPIIGENIGPFISGKRLTITCSTKSLDPVSLSWWEESKQLEAVGSNASTSLELETLQVSDNGRRFTCRDLVTRTEESVKLDVIEPKISYTLEIVRGVQTFQDEQVLNVLPGEDLKLTCVLQGYSPPAGSWWEGDKQLEATTRSSCYASSSTLLLRATDGDSERWLSCRAVAGQRSKTVRVRVKEERKNDTSPSPTETSNATRTRISPSNSTTATTTNLSSISKKVPNDDGTSPKASSEKRMDTTGENDSVATPSPDGQDTPVSGTGSMTNSMTTTTTKQPKETNETQKYFIAGGAAIAFIGLVVVILIFVILKLCRTINRLDTSTSSQQENPREQPPRAGTSVQTTLESLDPNDLPPLSPLLPRSQSAEGGDETTSSGGRISLLMPNDRDHSYYYPDLINNSYYYPKITDDVKNQILFSKSGQ